MVRLSPFDGMSCFEALKCLWATSPALSMTIRAGTRPSPLRKYQGVLLSLPIYAMLILWGTLAWILLEGTRAFISGSRATARSVVFQPLAQ